jgi:serine/threonine protein kinase
MPEVFPLQSGDPTTVAGHRLAGRLGEGGQGTVYLGHTRTGRPVAIKILHARLAADTTARKRFAREIHAAARVAPFCTARVLAADLDGDTPYLVSEYIDGPALQQAVRQHGPMHGADLRHLAIGTLTALAAIHQAGIIHRDFKPANVLLSAHGPKVVDFGIARALDHTSTLTSQAIGTPAYMAPEQLDGTTVTPATDLFAWACTIVYAATGGPPFGNDSVPAVIGRILEEEPGLGTMTGPLRDIAARCLAKDPAQRPTAQDLLTHLLGGPSRPIEATLAEGARAAGMPPLPPDRTRILPRTRWRGALIAGAAVMAVVLAAGAGILLWPRGAGGHPASSAPPAPTPTVPLQVAGWSTVSDKVEKIAYDVPPDWDASAGSQLGFGVPGRKSSVSLFAVGKYAKAPCAGRDFAEARATVGFTGYEKTDLRLVAKDAATVWASARYSRDAKHKATLDPRARTVESVSIHGMKAAHASATIKVPSPDGCDRPPSAVIHTVAMTSRGPKNRVAVFVVLADRGVAQTVPDQTLQQLIGSLRPATAR